MLISGKRGDIWQERVKSASAISLRHRILCEGGCAIPCGAERKASLSAIFRLLRRQILILASNDEILCCEYRRLAWHSVHPFRLRLCEGRLYRCCIASRLHGISKRRHLPTICRQDTICPQIPHRRRKYVCRVLDPFELCIGGNKAVRLLRGFDCPHLAPFGGMLAEKPFGELFGKAAQIGSTGIAPR